MYNEKQKYEFINSLAIEEITKKNYINFFEKLGDEIESDFQKDFCDFNYGECVTALTIFSPPSIKSKSHDINVLKRYIYWCIENGRRSLDSDNPLEIIDPLEINNINAFRETMVSSPEHLKDICEKGFEKPLNNSIDLMTYGYIWLLYNGFNRDEALLIKRDDIDIDNKIIKYNGKTINLLETTCDILEKIKKTDFLEDSRGKYTDLMKHGNLIQGFVKDDFISKEDDIVRNIRNFGTRITNMSEFYRNNTGKELRLSPTQIEKSGKFYRIYQKELKKDSILNEEELRKIIQEEFRFYNDIIKSNTTRKVTEKIKEYSLWKQAFSL